jgi:hypothetical protein
MTSLDSINHEVFLRFFLEFFIFYLNLNFLNKGGFHRSVLLSCRRGDAVKIVTAVTATVTVGKKTRVWLCILVLDGAWRCWNNASNTTYSAR